MEQKVLPAISDFKSLEKFLKTDLDFCIIMNFTLKQFGDVCGLLKEHQKKCIVHLDLIKGIANNEYGAEFIIEKYPVIGVISTHPSVIEVAKKKKIMAIMRFFIIDNMSLTKSIELAKRCKPDYIEILPGYAYEVEKIIHQSIDTPLIGGGLIHTTEMIDKCLLGKLAAVTCSNSDLWNYGK